MSKTIFDMKPKQDDFSTIQRVEPGQFAQIKWWTLDWTGSEEVHVGQGEAGPGYNLLPYMKAEKLCSKTCTWLDKGCPACGPKGPIQNLTFKTPEGLVAATEHRCQAGHSAKHILREHLDYFIQLENSYSTPPLQEIPN